MAITVEELDDQTKYRQILAIPYKDLISFVVDYLKRKSSLIVFFWSVCILFLVIAVKIRINVSGVFPIRHIIIHSFLGAVIFPLLCIPLHEGLHIIPYVISGAKRIRIGMDLKQYLFYVTAHRYVSSPLQFRIVAITPFIVISMLTFFLVLVLPGLWKWSLSFFLFVHTTMCAGDFALLNFYSINSNKDIYTWDDADQKIAYYYEKLP